MVFEGDFEGKGSLTKVLKEHIIFLYRQTDSHSPCLTPVHLHNT